MAMMMKKAGDKTCFIVVNKPRRAVIKSFLFISFHIALRSGNIKKKCRCFLLLDLLQDICYFEPQAGKSKCQLHNNNFHATVVHL